MKKTTARKVSDDTDTIDELRALVRDAEAALAAAGDSGDDKIKVLRERMKNAIDEGRAVFARAREYAREELDEADEFVRSHPYQTIGIAALAGVLVGVLITRKVG